MSFASQSSFVDFRESDESGGDAEAANKTQAAHIEQHVPMHTHIVKLMHDGVLTQTH